MTCFPAILGTQRMGAFYPKIVTNTDTNLRSRPFGLVTLIGAQRKGQVSFPTPPPCLLFLRSLKPPSGAAVACVERVLIGASRPDASRGSETCSHLPPCPSLSFLADGKAGLDKRT